MRMPTEVDGTLGEKLKLREFAYREGWPAFFGVMLGSAIGRSSGWSERYWTRLLGFLILRVRRVRQVTRQNLEMCFTEKSKSELDKLEEQSCRELARSVVETFKIWFPPDPSVKPYTQVTYRGIEHFEAAMDKNCGIMLLNCHYGSLDLNGSFFSRLDRRGRRVVGVYRQPTNPNVDRALRYGRSHMSDHTIPINKPREIVAELRAGNIVWIAPDLEASGPGSVFVDFCGVAASTTTWPSRLASMGRAVVLPTRHHRVSDKSEYVYEFLPPFEAFPSEDWADDARQFNQFVEGVIEQNPSMYWWCIKRFKHRPDTDNISDSK